MDILSAAEKVLRKSRGPLDCKELTRRIIEEGYWIPHTRTPVNSVAACLYVHLKKGGTRFVKVEKGIFALAGTDKQFRKKTKMVSVGSETSTVQSADVGYVYILTNPSLKGMVKIGKTRRPVNTRSKELYNTAIPTEFVEFASLKTSKFAQVEELVHRILTKLTHKRVNEKREFYKIKPQEALEILQDVSGLLDTDDLSFHIPGQSALRKPVTARKPKEKGVKWVGRTQLARLIACRGGNEGAFGGILHFFSRRRPCRMTSKWRKLLADAGLKFDTDDFVIDWSLAKNPL